MGELCNVKMMADSVPDEQSLFCNDTKGHSGQHSYTLPFQDYPGQAYWQQNPNIARAEANWYARQHGQS